MEWIEKAQRGDALAIAYLFRQHAPLVQALAKRFEETQEAFQAGCIGLMKAIRCFDAGRGFAFSTYAVPLILGEMKKTREKKISWRQQKKLSAANRLRDNIMKTYGREPTIEEMATAAGIPTAEMALLLESSKPIEYLDAIEGHERIADPFSERWLDRFFIQDILERMPKEYSYILRRRYIHCESQTALSLRLHVHQSALSRTEKKARLMFISAWQY